MFQKVLSQVPSKFQNSWIHFVKSDLDLNCLQRVSSDLMAGKEFEVMHRLLTPIIPFSSPELKVLDVSFWDWVESGTPDLPFQNNFAQIFNILI